MYGPWLGFTTWYYGSPVPNTILAKAYGYDNAWYRGISPLRLPLIALSRLRAGIFSSLGPAFGGNGFGFQLFADRGVIACLVLLLVIPGCLRAWRRQDLASLGIGGFVIVYSLYYVFAMVNVFGWYVVPLTAAAILVCAAGADLLLRTAFLAPYLKLGSRGLTVAFPSLHAILLPVSFRADRNIQQFVDTGNRKVIGEYLAGIMTPYQTVGCEPLGYVGYYSRRIVFDFPGLCNRKVTQFVREHRQNCNLLDMLKALRPDYLVLRPGEIEAAAAGGDGWLRRDYEVVREFRVPEARVRQLLFPESNVDLAFAVLRRKPGAPPQ